LKGAGEKIRGQKADKVLQNSAITKYQGTLGAIVLIVAGIWAWCHLSGLNSVESPIRARSEAENLAHAVLDFRADTGQWPIGEDGIPSLTPLLGRRAARQATSLATAGGGGMNGLGGQDENGGRLGREQAWIREIPLDPWGGSYRVVIDGTRVAIISAGPDGRIDTEGTRLWTRPKNINPGDGDDICVVLDLEQDGGS
jgi:hypothetical protein